jgi:hypothetical protein
MNPFGNALFDIFGIGPDDQFGIVWTKLNTFNCRGEFHAVIGGFRFSATQFMLFRFCNDICTPTA